MGLFRRKPRTIPAFDQPKTYHLPTPGELALQPNIERACEVYWAALSRDGKSPETGEAFDIEGFMPWDHIHPGYRDNIRIGVAAVLHWVQQQEKE